MILADTSVLIGYFKGLQGSLYEKLDYIIDAGIPFGICDYVYLELLQGARDAREYAKLQEYLSTLPFYGLRHGKQSFEKAAVLYTSCRKKGITIRSTLDVLIAEVAIENDLYLLHDDIDFVNLAKVCGQLKTF